MNSCSKQGTEYTWTYKVRTRTVVLQHRPQTLSWPELYIYNSPCAYFRCRTLCRVWNSMWLSLIHRFVCHAEVKCTCCSSSTFCLATSRDLYFLSFVTLPRFPSDQKPKKSFKTYQSNCRHSISVTHKQGHKPIYLSYLGNAVCTQYLSPCLNN